MYNFIQSHQIIDDIYTKTQLDAEKMAMRLGKRERQVAERVIQPSANTNKGDGARMNRFKDEIAEAM